MEQKIVKSNILLPFIEDSYRNEYTEWKRRNLRCSDAGAAAEYTIDYGARAVWITLATKTALQPTEPNLNELAQHEVIECMLTFLSAIAQDPLSNDDQIRSERHGIVHRIQHALRSKEGQLDGEPTA